MKWGLIQVYVVFCIMLNAVGAVM